jgi:DNA polymerase III epsilon subunit-like protein
MKKYSFNREGGSDESRNRSEERSEVQQRNNLPGEQWIYGEGRRTNAGGAESGILRQLGDIRVQHTAGAGSLGATKRHTPMKTIAIFDTETTGLLNAEGAPLESQPRIIEFAGIKLNKDLEEIERFEFICNPQCKLSDKITEITGLRDSDVADKPIFSSFYDKLCAFFLGCDTGIAHNYTFDLGMLRYEMVRLGRQFYFPWPYNGVCTVEKTMHIRGHRLNLTKLHKHCTDEDHVNGAHRAMNDVQALLRCVKKLREQNVL